ncbi:MAG: hypothetical protein JNM94_11155 [Phycisphaerae bacterium]|nr:hypothetical protein [Phycisphaerae bacterium]
MRQQAIDDGPSPEPPIAELDLPEPAKTLRWGVPEWSHDGTCIVVQREMDGRAWPWLEEHQADLALLIIVIALALGLRLVVRTVRRMRAVGRDYCRRCNHDLGEPATRGERCPECGSSLGARGAVVGRVRWWRLAPMLALCALVVAAGMFVVKGAVVGPTTRVFRTPSAWPIDALGRVVSGWPLWRADIRSLRVTRLDVVAIDAEGQLRRLPTGPITLPYGATWCMSDDGRMIAWMRKGKAPASSWEVCWFDVDANAEGSAVVESEPDGRVRACGFAPDGRSIVVRRDRAVTPPSAASGNAMDVRHDVEVLIVDPRDGTMTTVATSEAFALETQDGQRSIEPGVACVGPGPKATWATITLSRRGLENENGVSQLAHLVVGNGTESRSVALKRPVYMSDKLVMWTARILNDRELVIESVNRAHIEYLVPLGRFRIDLETGELLRGERPSPGSESALEATFDVPPGSNIQRTVADPGPAWFRLQIRPLQ